MTDRRPEPMRGRALAALGALAVMTAGAARAQETAPVDAAGTELLPTLNVDATGEGLYGAEFESSSVSVMKTDTPILETPRSVNVVTADQIQQRGARDIAQALQYTPGVVGTGGNDNRGDWLRVRGFEPTIFVDGMQSFFGYYNNTRPEPFLLDSISVLKGPSAMLYGNGAVGGIVNEASKLPDPTAPNIVRLEVGSNNLFQSGIDFNGSFGEDFQYRLVGLGRVADGPIDFSDDNAVAFAPSLTWTPTDATSVTLLGFYQKNDTSPYIQFLSPYGTLYSAEGFANGDKLPMDVFVGEPGFNEWDAERAAVSLFAEHQINSVWSVAGSLRYTETSVNYEQLWWAYDNFETGRYNPDGTINRAGERASNDSRSWIGDIHASADFTLGSTTHAVMFGAGFTDGRFNYDSGLAVARGPIDPFDPDYTGMADRGVIVDYPEYTLNQQSIYAQDQITWNDRLHFDIGLRYDWIQQDAQDWYNPTQPQNLEDGQLSTSVALLYAFDNGLSPYVSYSESFYQESVGTDVNGNPFDPTEGTQYEIGVKYQPVGTNLLFTAAAFDITKSNILVADPINPGFSVQNGEAKSKGIEFGAQGGWNGFTVDAGYTYLDTEGENGAPLAGVPDNQASAWLGYAPQGGQFFGAMGGFGIRYVGETYSGGVETPSTTLYDAMLGYQWGDYLLQLTGRNLADKEYVVNCDSSTCYYGDPRTFGLSLTAQF